MWGGRLSRASSSRRVAAKKDGVRNRRGIEGQQLFLCCLTLRNIVCCLDFVCCSVPWSRPKETQETAPSLSRMMTASNCPLFTGCFIYSPTNSPAMSGDRSKLLAQWHDHLVQNLARLRHSRIRRSSRMEPEQSGTLPGHWSVW